MRIITGMHRSGTSLVAKFLFEAGAPMGDPNTFYVTDQWNPEGYYEQLDLRQTNIRLLHGPWGYLSYLNFPSPKILQQRGKKRGKEIKAMIAKYANCVVKDPRFCFTLPVWIQHLAPITGIVICLREPVQVAYSLRKRNKTPLAFGVKVWQEHYERLLEDLHQIKNIPVQWVRYDFLLDPEKRITELEPIFRVLGYPKTKNEICVLADRLIKKDLHHHRRLDYQYPEKVRRIWEELKSRHAGI